MDRMINMCDKINQLRNSNIEKTKKLSIQGI